MSGFLNHLLFIEVLYDTEGCSHYWDNVGRIFSPLHPRQTQFKNCAAVVAMVTVGGLDHRAVTMVMPGRWRYDQQDNERSSDLTGQILTGHFETIVAVLLRRLVSIPGK